MTNPASSGGLNFGGTLDWGGGVAINPVAASPKGANSKSNLATMTLESPSSSKPIINVRPINLDMPPVQPLVVAKPKAPSSTSSPKQAAAPLDFGGNLQMDGYSFGGNKTQLKKTENRTTELVFNSASAPSTLQPANNSNSRELLQEHRKGGALSVKSITDFRDLANTFQKQFGKDMQDSLIQIKKKIDDYCKQTNKVSGAYVDFAMDTLKKATNEDFVADQGLVNKQQMLAKLVQDVTTALFLSAKQLIELQQLRQHYVLDGYKQAICVVYDERFKELELVDKMLSIAQKQEKSELDANLALHAAALAQEAQRSQQMLDLLRLSAELDQQSYDQQRDGYETRMRTFIELEEVVTTRSKQEQEMGLQVLSLQQQHALAIRGQDQEALFKKWDVEHDKQALKLQNDQFKMKLGVEERLALADLAAQEILGNRQLDIDDKKVDMERALGEKTIDAQKDVYLAQTEANKVVAVTKSNNEKEMTIETKKIEESGKTNRKIIGETGKTARTIFKPKTCAVM